MIGGCLELLSIDCVRRNAFKITGFKHSEEITNLCLNDFRPLRQLKRSCSIYLFVRFVLLSWWNHSILHQHKQLICEIFITTGDWRLIIGVHHFVVVVVVVAIVFKGVLIVCVYFGFLFLFFARKPLSSPKGPNASLKILQWRSQVNSNRKVC